MADHRKMVPAEFESAPTLEELATRQGVSPVKDFESILGPAQPEDDEPLDDFLALLREWRREGSDPAAG